jgi:rubrerythrin
MSQRPSVTIGDAGLRNSVRSRREVLKLMAMGGSLVLLPAALVGCGDSDPTGPSVGLTPNSGSPLVIDFAKGDVAVLQFAYALEQLEADFYTRVVASFDRTNLTAADKAILLDIKYHEVQHRELFKAALGASNDFTVNTTYPGVDFASRASILAAARTFEDLGVAAYNGAGQYLGNADLLTLAGKIVSVEARHAAVIRDLINPKSGEFAPQAFDDVFSPAKVAGAAQGFVVDRLGFANAPGTFVQGPNTNG